MYLGPYKLSTALVFSANTHNQMAEAADADSPPIYRIYQSGIGAPIATGSMTKLDDSNTTGLYIGSVTLSLANGFLNNTAYLIYMEGIVGGKKGSASHVFQIMDIPEMVWTHSNRTLTYPVATLTEVIPGSSISILRGDTIELQITGLGPLTGYTAIDFMVKSNRQDPDVSSILWIRKNSTGISDGLLILNKSTALDPLMGSIAIDNEAAGDLTITLSAEASVFLQPGKGQGYEIQLIQNADVRTLSTGTFNILADIIRAID